MLVLQLYVSHMIPTVENKEETICQNTFSLVHKSPCALPPQSITHAEAHLSSIRSQYLSTPRLKRPQHLPPAETHQSLQLLSHPIVLPPNSPIDHFGVPHLVIEIYVRVQADSNAFGFRQSNRSPCTHMKSSLRLALIFGDK